MAARQLTVNELGAVRGTVPRYERRPFSVDDVYAYVTKYFSTQWPQEDTDRRAHQ
ncbi:hypothetical protein [Nocardia sp. NPDC049707]|uniref:hypothetical protein n=1 Tax=Nocardia sp. NPDC049707 TaxID=3154735 RepID=UPI003447EF9F